MLENSTSSPADFTVYLSHADAAVRGRAWAWQSAMGLLLVDGLCPSSYLVETVGRYIEGSISSEMLAKLVEAYYLSRLGADTEVADRKALETARLLGGIPAAPAAATSSPPPPAEPATAASGTAAAPADASALHLRQKRLLKTLGMQTLGVPELLHALRLTTRQSFMRVWLTPAMEMGLVKALHPESPRHPQQKYLLTRKGQRFMKQLIRK